METKWGQCLITSSLLTQKITKRLRTPTPYASEQTPTDLPILKYGLLLKMHSSIFLFHTAGSKVSFCWRFCPACKPSFPKNI